ncbi:interleukin-2 precursor [Takifugu rubripes]|uniref:Interleukin n=1 Tax=Takifugu rubripes TaxID=31033 RepID=Q59A92_TAKRU|nr:interleukin-2 precursor [Takifugu rubripes]CAE50923.2 interleukin-2 [Takifugu rubripes]CAG39028.1 interleukin-2 precursor [Takifugu rubripes]|eukprot:NP_001033083.1 interleukin-2 precursor [Takifugu rubripes]
MENFIRINVWLGILCLCFPANPFPLHLEDSNIDVIREDVKCEPDSKFYTPANVRDDHHCIIVALECVAAELKTVRRECEDPEDVIGVAEEFLTHTIQKLKNGVKIEKSNSTECSTCESWPEKPLTNFLDATESLLQQVQSGAIPSAEGS